MKHLTKFNVGDRVKITSKYSSFLYYGASGAVIGETLVQDCWFCLVHIDGDKNLNFFYESELELIKD